MTATLTLAIDQSLRTKDKDGRLHISWTNISKATVNPYYGREIPGYQDLGLDPNRVYQLWRHPEELAKAAPTFNGIQLMSAHLGVDASGAMKEQVAGALGNDAEFRPPYLGNSMTIWWKDDIDDIESGKKCQLSCGYYYKPVMEPGVIDGLHYDGKMTEIAANHVALVKEGRAGPDVMVHDERLKRMPASPLASRKALMVKGAISAYLKPQLMAGTILALDSALGSVNRLNWKTQKPAVLAAVTTLAKPKLAPGATLDGLKLALDSMDEEEDGEAEDDTIKAKDESEEEEETEEAKAERMAMEKKARDKKAKDKKARDAKARDRKARDMKAKDWEDEEEEAEDEDLSESEREEKKEARDRKARDMKAKDKKAMDAAIATATTAVIARMNAAVEAREIVRPIIGNVSMALDSAEAIYKLALDAHKVDTTGVNPEGYRAMVKMIRRPGEQTRALALDSAGDGGGLDAMFPTLSRIGQS